MAEMWNGPLELLDLMISISNIDEILKFAF